MCNFHVGQRVVCVKDWSAKATIAAIRGYSVPTKGCIYTIRSVLERRGIAMVLLVEINNAIASEFEGYPSEVPMYADGFRPLVERKTDISIFTALLNPSKEEMPA